MTINDIKAKLTPGAKFTFTLPGQVTTLTVASNDGSTLIGTVQDGSNVNKTISWSLVGLDQVYGVDPA